MCRVTIMPKTGPIILAVPLKNVSKLKLTLPNADYAAVLITAPQLLAIVMYATPPLCEFNTS